MTFIIINMAAPVDVPSPYRGVSAPYRTILGIDLGTTSVKVSLVDMDSSTTVFSTSRETGATVGFPTDPRGDEQDVAKILTCVQDCVEKIPEELVAGVTRIGVTGQMHGVMLWRAREGWRYSPISHRFETGKVSRLYTWQDGRCTPEFLQTIPSPRAHLPVATGNGCATLLWLARHMPEALEGFDRAGTVMDYLVAMLCGMELPVMSVQNAASWGYFDCGSRLWNREILEEAGFPCEVLPRVLDPGEVAGTLRQPWCCVRPRIDVGVALGDLQCSVLPSLVQRGDAVLNIGTSAQLAFQMTGGFLPPPADPSSPVQYYPYFREQYLAVAAALTGGNALACFVKMIQSWLQDLGIPSIQEDLLYERLLASAQTSGDTPLTIVPTIFGERHIPDQRASVSNVTIDRLSVGQVTRSLCKGIADNLHTMMPREFLTECGVQRIVGTGSALTRNGILQEELERAYDIPLVYTKTTCGDAAYGAAFAMLLEMQKR
ncbi:sedoheptulokinase-like [Branchiostoma lanceolatum]|uniref:sedoheptulokinase-like n=1 Tax=Branchiostoma lanceolatum TaxID=7740 RepID=UPI0034524D1E